MKKPSAVIKAMQRYVNGHINKTMERHKFRCQTQQQGKSSHYIAQRVSQTCRFCSDAYMQQSIRDQVIEGLQDGDTVEDLLQESELTLATTVTKCKSKEAAENNWLHQ